MKFSISYLDEVSFEFSLSCSLSGELDVDAVFPVFLGRPGRPHLSFFAKLMGKYLSPHATAWKGTRRQDRVWLGKVSPTALQRWNDAAEVAMYAEYVAALEPVDLDAVSTDGWTAHWVDWRVLLRWLRPQCRLGGSVALSPDFVDALCLHVVRHGVLPGDLAGLDGWRCCLLLRWHDGIEEPDVRLLYHFPDGVPSQTPDGSVVIAKPPGWYWAPRNWGEPAVKQLTSGTRLERAVRRVEAFLGRHRRLSPAPQRDSPRSFSAFVLGFCAPELTRLALSLVAQHDSPEQEVPRSA